MVIDIIHLLISMHILVVYFAKTYGEYFIDWQIKSSISSQTDKILEEYIEDVLHKKSEVNDKRKMDDDRQVL